MLTVLVPMAGRGKRFVEAGYRTPKPFIPIHGRPMIHRVAANVRPKSPHQFVFLALSDHLRIGDFPQNSMVVSVPEVTEGAACTALLAKRHIDTSSPLLIVNSDQLIDWDVNEFLDFAKTSDGCIATFTADHPKWSYVRKSGPFVTEVVEKQVVSDEATCGVYYWAEGSDFVRCAEEMIAAGERTNGEFYIAPVFNRLIKAGGLVTTYRVPSEAMHGLGTPEDLEKYLALLKAQAA